MRTKKPFAPIHAVGLLVVLAALWITQGTSFAADKFRFIFNWIPYGAHTGFYAAQERGFYKAAGLDVTLDRGYGSSDTAKKIATGVGDAGLSDFPAVVRGRAGGLKIKAVGVMLARDVSVIFARKDRGIEKPADLIGRTIGAPKVSALRSTFPAFARANGFDPGRVVWVDMPASAMSSALLSGQVDAIATFITVEKKLKAAGRKNNVEINSIPFSDYGLDLYSLTMVASDQTIAGNPDRLKRFVGASWKGIKWAVDHPDSAVKDLIRNHGALNEQAERGVWEIVVNHMLTDDQLKNGLGMMAVSKVQKTRDITLESFNIKQKIPLEELYTNRFLPKLLPQRASQ